MLASTLALGLGGFSFLVLANVFATFLAAVFAVIFATFLAAFLLACGLAFAAFARTINGCHQGKRT